MELKDDKQAESGFPKLSEPALRALNGAGYTRLEQLTRVKETEIAALHGMGPKVMRILKEALAERRWGFAES